jgi:hypothetical protein
VEDQKIEKWVEKQLGRGVSPRKLKKVLERKGCNPELVDEVTGDDSSNEDLEPQSPVNELEKDDEQKVINEENTESGGKKNHPLRSAAPDLGLSGSMRWKKSFEAITLLMLVALGAFLVTSTSASDNFGSFADTLSSEKPVEDSHNDSELSGQNTVTVDLEDGVAKPSRPKVSSNEKVVFRNRENHTLEISFGTEKSGFRIEPDETVSKRFSSITYYTASPVGTEGMKIYGSVNVQ